MSGCIGLNIPDDQEIYRKLSKWRIPGYTEALKISLSLELWTEGNFEVFVYIHLMEMEGHTIVFLLGVGLISRKFTHDIKHQGHAR